MKTKHIIPGIITMLMVGAIFLNSCKKKKKEEADPDTSTGTYAVHGGSVNNTSRYVLQASALNTGSVTAVGGGADVTTFGTRPGNMIVKNGFYYNLNTTNNKFGKYKYENNTLVAVTEIPFTAFTGVRSSNWIDDNTLLISGENSAETDIYYGIIDVANMSVISSGPFNLPGPPSTVTNHNIQAGTTFKRGNRLFVGYSYYENDNAYAILDTVYVTAVDYPAMTNPVHLKDARSAGGGGGSNMSWSILDGSGDLYLMTCPGDFYGVSAKPTGILRIKNGQEVFDASYFFNLSTLVNNDDPLTITSLGNGKFITRNIRQDLIINYSDFTGGFVYEYYVGDLSAQTLTKINNIPLHKGLFNNVLVDGSKANFVANSETSGTYVYEYDIASGAVSKGLEIQGLAVTNWIAKVQ